MGNEFLDRFGSFLMRSVRDETISDWEMIVDGRMKGDDAEKVRARLKDCSSQQIAAFASIVAEIVDSTLHNLLWGLEQEDAFEVVGLTQDGQKSELSKESDGLPGELYGDNGWIARFSLKRQME